MVGKFFRSSKNRKNSTSEMEILNVSKKDKKTRVMAELKQNVWFFKDFDFTLPLYRTGNEDHLFEAKGGGFLVRIFSPRISFFRTKI